MVNNTVNNKKRIIEGAAGINDKVKTTAVAWQNNRPQKLEIEVTNSAELQNLPFVIENADKIKENAGAVVVKARNITKEDMEKRKVQKDKNEDAR